MSKESGLNKFLPSDSKARAFLMLGLLLVLLLGLYFYLTSRSVPTSSGDSKVANVPDAIQNVPGNKLTPEYQSALVRANANNAKAAQLEGQSSVATLINYSDAAAAGGAVCTATCCSCDNVDMNAQVRDLLANGQLTADAADRLLQLQDANASVSDYAATLDQLVKEGKLTPAQARKLLEQYQKNQTNKLADADAKALDKFIKSGQLPLVAANTLLALQKRNVSAADYAKALQQLVAEGKISPAVAQQLLAEYQKNHPAVSALDGLVKQGKVSADVAAGLKDMQGRNVSVADYAAALNQLVKEGKISPQDAARLLSEYRAQHPADYSEAAGALAQWVKAGKISADVAKSLLDLQQNGISPQDYAAQLDRLVKEGKLSPAMRNQLLQDYQRAYADRVQGLTELTASSLVDTALPSLPPPAQPIASGASSSGGFAALQQRMARNTVNQSAGRFDAQAVISGQQAQMQLVQQQQQELRDLQTAMRAQAQQIYGSWNTVSQQQTMQAVDLLGSGGRSDQDGFYPGSSLPPIIRAGDIIFAVLDTEVNSDYPDSVVIATIIEGKYKGAKLMGKIKTGVNDNTAVMLSFNLMSFPTWPTAAKVEAAAVDPDTARQAMATDVNHHYIERYGTLFLSSFLSGYADSLTSAGTSQISADGNTVNVTSAPISPRGRIMVGLGKVGDNASDEAQKVFKRPPTVTVAPGVGLGIFFLQDVQEPTSTSITDTTSNSGTKPVTNVQRPPTVLQNTATGGMNGGAKSSGMTVAGATSSSNKS